ncbi:HAAS signaling domain-containing protein [Streptoalloteichus hindustanus]|uniref:DUF1700 domain-containing protein n=1 Tax=Streptoalloteichus hindustanus TaxID=2017 RepID=A0A1M4YMB5_STRHI|nr:hypothetical protein [Streptoalloteichus hindustanus]SHF06808.1 hypothetical protein SAMN05444320_102411 [Streptoalloteichus hindustanus]
MSHLDHPLVMDYLDRLTAAARVLPSSRRSELIVEIRSHLTDTMANITSPSEAKIRQALDRIGDPEEIVSAERHTMTETRPGMLSDALRSTDYIGLALIIAGGAALPPLGYLAGCALVGVSRRFPLFARILLAWVPALVSIALSARWVSEQGWPGLTSLGQHGGTLLGGVKDLLSLGVAFAPFTLVQAGLLVLVRQWWAHRSHG